MDNSRGLIRTMGPACETQPKSALQWPQDLPTIDLVHPLDLKAVGGPLKIVEVELVEAGHCSNSGSRKSCQRREPESVYNPETILQNE